ncbi:endopeptidase La [Candidatus Poribacteria bacterium]|nr:endopeptidase La [Candidatus Poribacteria bacterium]
MSEHKRGYSITLDKLLDQIPPDIGILPIRNAVIYPYMIVPLIISHPKSMKLVDDVMNGNRVLALVSQKHQEIEYAGPDDLYSVGTAASIVEIMRLNDSVQLFVQGLARTQIVDYIQTDPYLLANIKIIPEENPLNLKVEALKRNIKEMFIKVASLDDNLPDELGMIVREIENPSKLTDLVASNLEVSISERQAILETVDLSERMELLMRTLNQQLEVLELSDKIQKKAIGEMDKAQREFYLRKQLDAIQKELGEFDEYTTEIEELEARIEKSSLTLEAKKEADRELNRLKKISPESPEYTVSRTYLDWLVELPWENSTEDNLDIAEAKQILDEDHYGLTKVKDRILEYLAVRKLKSEMKGPILCFVGPPGVGKTSLGKSIARAMGRKCARLSLGGIRDEAEIRGHRRTYIGSMPGRIIQSLRKVGVNNPVFMLDEVDKLGTDFRGDPASALLEVLDPEQNDTFRDHYLDVTFDLSKVLFITTANILDTIPIPLQDRMEIISIEGYTEFEKLNIAQQFLIPRQLDAHGLKPEHLKITDEALNSIIRSYTREAGVRNLERELATICRKVAKIVAEGNEDVPPFVPSPGGVNQMEKTVISDDNISEYLGQIKYFSEVAEQSFQPGIAVGLAWTPAGGDILFIEATRIPGSNGKLLTLTGQLGDVMQESAQAALSYVRAHTDELSINKQFFEQNKVHIHIPSGAVPKDGPSAGVTLVTALASLATNRPIRNELAMTGEISLRGKVLPVGGIKEKVLAASRSGIKTIILPQKNQKDLNEVPLEVKKKLKFHFIERVDEALKLALLPPTALAMAA